MQDAVANLLYHWALAYHGQEWGSTFQQVTCLFCFLAFLLDLHYLLLLSAVRLHLPAGDWVTVLVED